MYYNFKTVESIQEKVKQTTKDSELTIKVLPIVLELMEGKYKDKKITKRFFTELKKVLKERNIQIEVRCFHNPYDSWNLYLSDMNRKEYKETAHKFYLWTTQKNFDDKLIEDIKKSLEWAISNSKKFTKYTKEVIEQTQAALKELETESNKREKAIDNIMPLYLLTY